MSDKKACSFCGKTIKDNVLLIQGPDQETVICSECVKNCVPIVDNFEKDNNKVGENAIKEKSFKPSDLKKYLDEYVIGQEQAKILLSVAVYNHLKMLNHNEKNKNNPDTVKIEKSNILLLGPTGCGKTFLAKLLAEYLNVPFAIADATSMTEAGYVGEDVENCVRKLIDAADGDIKKAEHGIIYIDEIDKKSRKGENMSITKDVSGEGVQDALLKLIEGSEVEVPPKGGRKHPNQACMKIDTTNILFIVGGAFESIDKIIEKRLGRATNKIGIGSVLGASEKRSLSEVFKDVKVEDLIKYGLKPEFIGRLPVICPLEELDEDALLSIITEPKNALLKQYQALMGEDNVKLDFDRDALIAVAKKAIERKTGARSLRGIMENILINYMYSIPDDDTIEEVTITKEVVEGTGEPIIVRKEVI